MTTNQPFEAVARLISDRPDLAEALQAASDADEAIAVIAKAGSESGFTVDTAGLKALLAGQAADAKLSEAELDKVAGGSVGGAVLSIFTVGIGCAAVSLATVDRDQCGAMINKFIYHIK